MVTGRDGREKLLGPDECCRVWGLTSRNLLGVGKNDDGGACEGWLNFARPAVGEWEALT